MASTHACVSATSSSTWAARAVEQQSTWQRSVDTWLDRLDLASRASDRLDALSHGNQQRVQLIAALVNEPELLVLDEPFSGLDPLAIAAMSELLAELAGGRRDRPVLEPPARPRRGHLRGRRHHRRGTDRPRPAISTICGPRCRSDS